MPDGIPDGITASDVLDAISDLDRGVPHGFGPSIAYDLVIGERRYPPKAVLGLAARRLAGRTLSPYDFKGGEGSRCFRLLRELGFDIHFKSIDSDSTALSRTRENVVAEDARRRQLWERLEEHGNLIPPTVLRELGIYGGAQGIWVDKERTEPLTDDGCGVTVAVLHTGSSYADDLSMDGVLYHYPSTGRPAGRDRSEIEATKAAGVLGLPIFVITYPSPSSNYRHVDLGWVESWDDDSRVFLITFGKSAPALLSRHSEDKEPFRLVDDDNRTRRSTLVRTGQQRFKFRVIQRYGPSCMVCGVSVADLLEAAHIRPKSARGSDDPRNGVVLCATHHRAYDASLFAIEPGSLCIRCRSEGPTADQLRISIMSLRTLESKPHEEAIAWRWNRWTEADR
jgi:putative restriction endonuclease